MRPDLDQVVAGHMRRRDIVARTDDGAQARWRIAEIQTFVAVAFHAYHACTIDA